MSVRGWCRHRRRSLASLDGASSSRAVLIMDTRWQHPFGALISGPSGSGKSVFVKKFVTNLERMCSEKIDRVILYYSEWQPIYTQLGASNIEFKEGLPQNSDFYDDPRAKLVIIDDLMSESSGKTITNLYTKGSHHRNLSVIFITQNLFHQGLREVSLNSNYIVVFKNPRDKAQIRYFARQICPEDPLYVQEAWLDATSKPFGYLLFDLKQTTPDNCRLRTNIFPEDKHHVVYLPTKNIKSWARGDQVSIVRI